jgi:hypothetical protein
MWGNIQGIGISPRNPPPKFILGMPHIPKAKKKGKNDLRHFEK